MPALVSIENDVICCREWGGIVLDVGITPGDGHRKCGEFRHFISINSSELLQVYRFGITGKRIEVGCVLSWSTVFVALM